MKIRTLGNSLVHAAAFSLVAALCGCGGDNAAPSPSSVSGHTAKPLPAELFLDSAPQEVAAVKELKVSAKEGDEVAVRTVVGGRKSPVVAGRAVWMAVDADLYNACTRPGHGCPEPWDYCCAEPNELKQNSLTIQVLDEKGRPLAVDLDTETQIAPMTTLVVRGTVAARPNPETLVVNATGIFVED